MLYEDFFMEYFMTFIISGILAFIVAFSATPIAKKLALILGAVDVPKDGRRMHKKPIARLGGLAIACGFLVSILFNSVSTYGFELNRHLGGLLIGVFIILAIGILDDIRPVNAKIKLVFQIAAALAVIIISDTRIETITNPFAPSGYSDINIYVSYPLTVLWIVGITNAINLIDGLDGLAAGVSSICSLSLFFISIMRTDIHPTVAIFSAIVTVSLAGSALGFLPFNFNPAKIFMGDTGATFLGFTLAAVSIHGTLKSYAAISIAIPLLVLGLPLFDTAFAVLRRVISGKSPMEADRGHLHHRLIDMGLSHKQSVVVMYTASGALGLCAIVLANRGALSAIILLVSVSVFIIGGAKYMNEISEDTEESQQDDASIGISSSDNDNTESQENHNKNNNQISMTEIENLENS